MSSKSSFGMSEGVALITQSFTEGSQLFQEWRKRGGKKAVGQEELDTALYEGQTSLEKKLKAKLSSHGQIFDIGDSKLFDVCRRNMC